MAPTLTVVFSCLIASHVAPNAVVAEPTATRQAETEIRSLMAMIQSARSARDPSSVEAFYSDDFYIVHTNAAVAGKSEWLQSFRAAAFRAQWEQMRFHQLGDTVLVLADVRVTGTLADGRAIDKRERTTYVWVRHESRWRLAAMHGTRMAQ